MNEKIPNPDNIQFPIWCWVKCYNFISPPKRKGNKISGFDVKITFNKDEEEVLVTDYRRYSFVLNSKYIPDVGGNEVTIEELFERCITNDSDILQGTVWDIKLSEVEKIEILKDDGYMYGSLNYVRKNNKRKDWIKEYYDIINNKKG